ncbi:MAG: head completion/stabilization protein, partial [Plesiomonas sp.]
SSATSEAVKDADAKDQTADDLYRDARFAIRDILGVTRITVELI